MNARQTKKKLTQKIRRLESDNNLMRKIIADDHAMQELYNKYSEPVNIQNSTIEFQEIRAKRLIPAYMSGDEDFVKYVKSVLARDIFEAIKDDVSYTVVSECGSPAITASIFVGRKD